MSPVGNCVVCKKSDSLSCAACHSVHYCGKEHQLQDWPNHKALCRSYEVKDDHVVATINIKKGKVIMEEIPIVLGPSYLVDMQEICPGCHQEVSRQRCRSCNWPVCSAKCAGLVDPARHGAECALLTKIKKAVIKPFFEVILPLRCLLLQKNNPKEWKVFLKMAERALPLHTSTASHESMYVLKEFFLKPLRKFAPELLPDCSDETVKKVYAVLDAYGLQVEGSILPLYAVCRFASQIEHSCLPNSHQFRKSHSPNGRLSQDRVVIQATQDISKGENITILFVDTWMSTHLRQVSLWQNRGVLCQCARCLDPRELGTDFGTLRCTKTGCSGWVLSVIPPEKSPAIDHYKCEQCGEIYSFADIEKLNKRLRNEIDACRSSSIEDIRKDEAMLDRLQKFVHPNHHYCMVMKVYIADYYGRMLMVQGERMSDALLKKASDMCLDVIKMRKNPALVLHDWQTFNASVILGVLTGEIARRRKTSK